MSGILITAAELNEACAALVQRIGPLTNLKDALAMLVLSLGSVKGAGVMTDRELVELCERLLTEMFVVHLERGGVKS